MNQSDVLRLTSVSNSLHSLSILSLSLSLFSKFHCQSLCLPHR